MAGASQKPNVPEAADQSALAPPAPRETLRSLASAFRRPSDDTPTYEWAYLLGGTAVVLFALWLIARRVLRTETPQPCRNPGKLFRNLCRIHRLSRRRRRLLERLAQAHQLTSPGLLFVLPGKFDVRNLDAAWRRHQEELDQIKSRLFGA